MSLVIRSDQYRRINIKSKRKKPYIINIGCGTKCEPDAIGIDCTDHGQEILWDVMEGIPLPDRSVKEVRMYHFVEHISYENLDMFFREIYRICIPDALVDIRVPHKNSPDAYSAPHLSFWDEKAVDGCFSGFVNSKQERLPLFRVEWTATKDDGKLLCFRVKVCKKP